VERTGLMKLPPTNRMVPRFENPALILTGFGAIGSKPKHGALLGLGA
jgi:hypothetical protein